MTVPDNQPSWRKPAGMFLILALIAGWAFLVGSCAGMIGALPAWAQVPIYIIAGVIWIAPLKPLLSWMETGRWRSF